MKWHVVCGALMAMILVASAGSRVVSAEERAVPLVVRTQLGRVRRGRRVWQQAR